MKDKRLISVVFSDWSEYQFLSLGHALEYAHKNALLILRVSK